MFALFGLSCTRFAVTICPALLKSLSWSTACWNGQTSSGILRQEREIILMEFPPLEWVVISINCRKLQVSGNFACRAISWWLGWRRRMFDLPHTCERAKVLLSFLSWRWLATWFVHSLFRLLYKAVKIPFLWVITHLLWPHLLCLHY